ncbi:MAG: N-acetyltransferase family protein [Rhizobiaceae bacterium]|nr:N-acetyltransferase family protein [Rhizobiaceae bacterium]
MPSLTIRPAAMADIPAITRIYGHAVENGTGSYELEPPTEAEMARRFRTFVDDGFPYLVAADDGGIQGYAYAGAFRPRRAYRFTVENSVYVHPDAHRRGVGRALLEALVRECAAMGFRQIVAVIGDGARHMASVRLHESLGFTHAGTMRGTGYKHGQWLDTVLMQLPINGGDSVPPDPSSLPERKFRGEL